MKLRLLETCANSLSMGKNSPGLIIESCSEAGESLQFFELCIREFKCTRDGPICRKLGLTSDARDRLGHVNRRKDAQLEKVRREIELTVGNRNEISGKISRYVLRLGLDDRQSCKRTSAEVLTEMCSAFQQS